jgi:transposase
MREIQLLFGQMPRFEPSTKRMSCCGHVQDVAISERVVVCQKCSTVHDRDQNAAQSILEFCRKLWPAADCQTSSEAVRAIDRRIPRL